VLVVRAADALEDGDQPFAQYLLELAGQGIERNQAKLRCDYCGRRFSWPGQLRHHLEIETSHGERLAGP
jgi:hypothetical protein